jgi:hypothetical protein
VDVIETYMQRFNSMEKAIISLFNEDLIRNLSNVQHFRTHGEGNQASIGPKKLILL